MTYSHPSAMSDMIEIFGSPIHTYSRAQALADGVLVDVSEAAAERGFKVPVAMTRTVWEDCVAWAEADSDRQTYQDQEGRLHDVLWLAWTYARIARRRDTDTITYELRRVPRGGRATRPRRVVLTLKIHGGDHGEPVATIMQPDED